MDGRARAALPRRRRPPSLPAAAYLEVRSEARPDV
jgi:hypothetical protein